MTVQPTTALAVRRADPVASYYLATPLFALADFGLSAPVRVAGLEDPLHRGAYYAVLFGCGLLCRARPRVTPWIGMLESAGNILLLILAIMIPVYALPEAFWTGAELVSPFSKVSIANFVISGTALLVSFYRNQHAALYGVGRSTPRSPEEAV